MNEEKALSKDISDLETNQQYYVGVRAYTKVGPGPYSSNITYSTGTETKYILIFYQKCLLSIKYIFPEVVKCVVVVVVF